MKDFYVRSWGWEIFTAEEKRRLGGMAESLQQAGFVDHSQSKDRREVSRSHCLSSCVQLNWACNLAALPPSVRYMHSHTTSDCVIPQRAVADFGCRKGKSQIFMLCHENGTLGTQLWKLAGIMVPSMRSCCEAVQTDTIAQSRAWLLPWFSCDTWRAYAGLVRKDPEKFIRGTWGV